MSKRILFVSHNASRSGAPILLLRLLRWLRANTDYQLDILVLRGGPLEDEFYSIAKPVEFTGVLRRIHAAGIAGVKIGARLHRAGLGRKMAIVPAVFEAPNASRALSNEIYDLIYLNTAAAGFALPVLKRFGCPVMAHIHELEYALGQLNESWSLVREHSDHFIAVSRAVEKNLIERHHISPSLIDVVYGFIDASEPEVDRAAARRRIRDGLGLTSDTFLVGGSGTIEWRKGTDLFVQVAAATATDAGTSGEPVFMWIGDNPMGPKCSKLLAWSEQLGLIDRIAFVSEMANPSEFFAALDLFALTSREDPFPLVCLEAGALGVPTLCFEGCGGIPELLERGGGGVIPGLSPEAMAAEIRRYATDTELLARESEAIRRNVLEHNTVDIVAPQIAAIIERLAGHTP